MISIIRAYSSDMRLALLAVLAYLIAILTAIIMHELAHGWVAYKNGDATAKFAGRLTLNPLKHLDPVGMALMLLVGFGWAKPVPVDSRNFRNYKKGMITVSLAGVTCNLIIAILSGCVLAIIMASIKGVTQVSMGLYYFIYFLRFLFTYLMVFNLTLMAFNLLPVFPLDGFRIVETLAKPYNKYVDFNYRYGNFILLGVLILSTVLGYITPYLDIFGLYINGVIKLASMIFNAIFGMQIL